MLVAKFLYDLFDAPPDRLDVVVFKYPGDGDLKMRDRFPLSGPFRDGVPMNYIKRLIGLPGETIAIHNGNLYVLHAPDQADRRPEEKAPLTPRRTSCTTRSLKQYDQIAYFDLERVPEAERAELAKRLWEKDHMRVNERDALDLFQSGEFQIIRKAPDTILSMRRIVYDNDHPAKDLAGVATAALGRPRQGRRLGGGRRPRLPPGRAGRRSGPLARLPAPAARPEVETRSAKRRWTSSAKHWKRS